MRDHSLAVFIRAGFICILAKCLNRIIGLGHGQGTQNTDQTLSRIGYLMLEPFSIDRQFTLPE